MWEGWAPSPPHATWNKRNIIDFYNNKYQLYSGRIDDILYKKDLDKEAINKNFSNILFLL